MTVSQLVEALQALQSKHGDVHVEILVDDGGCSILREFAGKVGFDHGTIVIEGESDEQEG